MEQNNLESPKIEEWELPFITARREAIERIEKTHNDMVQAAKECNWDTFNKLMGEMFATSIGIGNRGHIPGSPVPELEEGNRRGKPWVEGEEEYCVSEFSRGKKPKQIASVLRRTSSAIIARLEQLGMIHHGSPYYQRF